MYKFFTATIITLSFLMTACSSTPEAPNKGADLDTLEAQANYISSKNMCKKMTAMRIQLAEKPFLLGAFDVRDSIAARVPENSFYEIVDTLHKEASPLANISQQPLSAKTNKYFNEDLTSKNSDLPKGLRTREEWVSYLTAYSIAKGFGKNGIPVMPLSMMLGLTDSQTKDALKISTAEEKEILKMIKEKIRQPNNDWAENRHQYYIAEEKSFFSSNITKPHVMSLDSGVQYLVTKKSTGKLPTQNDSVTVHYKGYLLDGTEFDSSYKRNLPATFKLNEMISGFTQALTHVPEGSSLIMYIPATLAYNDKGADIIPPYAAIIFEVDFINIKTSFFN